MSGAISTNRTQMITKGRLFHLTLPCRYYRNGDIIHLEGVIQQFLPPGSKTTLLGVGANAFLYDQVTGDSGSGARLGDFEGRSVGVGPIVTFGKVIGKSALVFQVKWPPELDPEKRLNGDWVWVSGGFKF